VAKVITFHTEAEMPPLAMSLADTLYNKTGSWRYMRPVYEDKTPPCNHACPAGEKVQGYLALVLAGDFEGAWRLLVEDNPFPSVCGRVCYHPCEEECNRGRFDQPLGIHHVERFLGDYAAEQGLKLPAPSERRPEKVAVVGAGPAGLSCAYQLARRGYAVTVFEALSEPGGMLRVGIPAYRLPKDVLKREIAAIEALGVEIRTGMRLGANLSWDELAAYDAVFLATGAHRSRRLGVPGEEATGVLHGVDFLREVNLGRKVALGKRVAVIGGGNTALDAARVALRLGASPFILYRRGREEMPATDEEVEEALAEGIEIRFLIAPVEVLTRDGRVRGLRCVQMQLGEPDASGRRRPIPIPGSEFEMEVDTVIAAIGQEAELGFLPPDVAVEKGAIRVDEHGATSRAGLFAGGDATTGPGGMVVRAIGAGKRAALAIDCYLRGEEMPLPEEGHVVTFEELNTAYFEPAERVTVLQLAPQERVRSFAEVNGGYDADMALAEAARCFSCGVCNRCDNCWLFCPDVAVILKDDGYEFNYDYCKGCGVCVSECPRNAISLKEEQEFAK